MVKYKSKTERTEKMNKDQKLYGFAVTREQKIEEIGATLYLMEHKGSGAHMCYLERPDTNKTFAIAFPTLPENSTGVFHIIEHSVLCGSKKFPVKEPFVELLKGSLNTFLNAMTYEDRTVYPVASRCDKDFYNLTDIYLDAVFHPKMLENENIFRQEGHHLEIDDDSGEMSVNGVVYNEMKGARSSPDELGFAALKKILFDGNLYAFDSGGDPDEIPSLTYESFKAAHKKYYTAKNAYIFLDGSVRLDEILPLISSYLTEDGERFTIPTPPQGEPFYKYAEIEYDAGSDKERDSDRLMLGYNFSDISDTKGILMARIIADAIAETNDSPLKKAVLESGLCEDINLYFSSTSLHTLIIEVRGIRKDNKDKIKQLIDLKIRELAERGIDREALSSLIGRLEFKLREADFGSLGRGVAYALSVFGSWCYGLSPETGLVYNSDLSAIKELLSASAYEELLLNMTVSCPYRAELIMAARDGENERREERERKALAVSLASMTEREKEEIRETSRALALHQASKDPDSALATIPRLSISDIDLDEQPVPTTISEALGCKIISHPIETSGILYTRLYFNASDLDKEELALLNLLASVLSNLPTKNYTPSALSSLIKAKLGSFSVSPVVCERADSQGNTTPYLLISLSALKENAAFIQEVLSEVLTKTDYTDALLIKRILLQIRSMTEDAIISSGESTALSLSESGVSKDGILSELIFGIDAYEQLTALAKESETDHEALSSKTKALAEKLFTRSRLTLSVAGGEGLDAGAIVSMLRDGEMPRKAEYEKEILSNTEGFAIPARSCFAALSAASADAKNMLGTLRVVRSILSYEYLWSAIRVEGGAYGTGFVARKTGVLSFYSYRDPSPERSLGIFRGSPAFLRSLAQSEEDITKFIIGAVGDYSPLRTPRTASLVATQNYLTGWTNERELEVKEQMLRTDKKSLLRAAELLEEALERSHSAVVADKETLERIKDLRNNIRSM